MELSLIFARGAIAYLSEAPYGDLLLGLALALLTNIRLRIKSLPGTNTLAFCLSVSDGEASFYDLGKRRSYPRPDPVRGPSPKFGPGAFFSVGADSIPGNGVDFIFPEIR